MPHPAAATTLTSGCAAGPTTGSSRRSRDSPRGAGRRVRERRTVGCPSAPDTAHLARRRHSAPARPSRTLTLAVGRFIRKGVNPTSSAGGEVVRSRNLGAGPPTHPILRWTTSSRTCSRPRTWSSRRARRRRSASRRPARDAGRARPRLRRSGERTTTRVPPRSSAQSRRPPPADRSPEPGLRTPHQPCRRLRRRPTARRSPTARQRPDLRAPRTSVPEPAPRPAVDRRPPARSPRPPPSTRSWSADASSRSPAARSRGPTRATR